MNNTPTWVILLAMLPGLLMCFAAICMALDAREDDRRTAEYEAERDAFYAKLRKEREPKDD